MIKIFSASFFIAALSYSSCYAGTQVDEIVLSTNNGIETAVSSQIGNLSEKLYCNGHIVSISIDKRNDFDGNEEFISNSMKITVNGQDYDSYKLLADLNRFYGFSVNHACQADGMGIYVNGHNDSATESGTTIVDLWLPNKQSND